MTWNTIEQDPLQQTYDAVVVGSGATGGWAAKQLAESGLKVALLEAGRAVSPTEFTEHTPAYQLKYRDHSPEIARTRPIQKQCYACMEYNYEWFVNDLENPYSTPPDKPFTTWDSLMNKLRLPMPYHCRGGCNPPSIFKGSIASTPTCHSAAVPVFSMPEGRLHRPLRFGNHRRHSY